MRSHSSPAVSRQRSGLTVVEVLVALMLVSVGLLGIAGSSALALRSARGAAQEERAARRASTRLARLGAAGCARAISGSLDDADGAPIERWTVGPVNNGAARLQATVFWSTARGRRTLTVESALLC